MSLEIPIPSVLPATGAAQTIAFWANIASTSGTQTMVVLNGTSNAVKVGIRAVSFAQKLAVAKAQVAWKNGMDAHAVQELKPWLLEEGDTVLWGAVVVDGITVSASGAHAWFVEGFAGAVAACLKALAKRGAAAARQKGLFLQAR